MMRPAETNAPLAAISARLRDAAKPMPPAVLALCLQLVALGFVLALATLAHALWSVPLYLERLVLLQAAIAVGLCWIAHMAVWWRWIHALFPLALLGMSAWAVPNVVYLAGFILSLSLFWTTFRNQVPFFPSRASVRQPLASLLPRQARKRVIDIGSGLGDLAMYLAKARKECQVEGIEIAPLPWLISRLRALLKQSNAKLMLGNYEALDFAAYDMVFAYLSPAAMPGLWQKARREMRTGSLLVSYAFEIPDVIPSMVIDVTPDAPSLFVWKIA